MRTLLLTSLAAAAAITGVAAAQPAQDPVHWSYEGETGPEHWAGLSPEFAACGEGSRQSPIDLRDPARRPAARIATDYSAAPVTLANNGETVEVRSDAAQTLRVGRRSYELVQLHFHTPGEHSVAGSAAPAEVHFVHQAADGERAVLGAAIRRGRANRAFGRLTRALPEEAGDEARARGNVDLEALLPASRRAFRYPGSLTTPPCSEGIRWMVLAKPIRVSPRQLEAIERVVEGNARPVQPRNDRPLVLG